MTLQEFSIQLKRMPMTKGFATQIEILVSRYGNEYETMAEEVLGLFDKLGYDAIKTARRYIYDYLKQMEFFLQKGEYGHTDYAEVREQIYNNEETMLETYMPGLLLSYAYTTILYEKNHLFLTKFLPAIAEKSHGVEIGFGEGFYLWEAMNRRFDIRMTGFDISPYAIQFASHFLQIAEIPSERYKLEIGNVFEGLKIESGCADFAIFAEVLEHIPNPDIGLREVIRVIRRGGLLYLTTVKDSNHMDHVSNFESPEYVEKMIESEGMRIIDKCIYHMKDDFPESSDISIGLAFVAEKK